jgi:integrase
MASIYEKRGRFWVRWKAGAGRGRDSSTPARTRGEAKRICAELEEKAFRARQGLEELIPEDGGGTLSELLEWWLRTYSRDAPSHVRNEYTLRKHIIGTKLGTYPLASLVRDPGPIETFLQEKSRELSAQSLNHLRRFMLTAFNCARRAGRWRGLNPVKDVRRRRVAGKAQDFLRFDEVPRVLTALAPRWRPLFAVALYTGLRKGELAGLRKTDVDLANGLLTVSRSYGRATTKGGHADIIPIHPQAMPYFAEAIRASETDLVFPAVEGQMMREDQKLGKVLRRALARAGIVTGYEHVCRRKGCGHAELAKDKDGRRCPTCNMVLWPKARVRPIRFHDLRHTTASLFLMSGVPFEVVQAVLRHKDPKLTLSTYGHLLLDHKRKMLERVSLLPDDFIETQQAAEKRDRFAAYLLPLSKISLSVEKLERANLAHQQEKAKMRRLGLEPRTTGLKGRCSTN